MSKVHELRRKLDEAKERSSRLHRYKPSDMTVAAHSLACAAARLAVAAADYSLTEAIIEEASAHGGVEASTEMEVETDEGRVETVRGHGLVIPATDTRDGVSYLLATEGEPTERQRFALEDALYGEAVAS